MSLAEQPRPLHASDSILAKRQPPLMEDFRLKRQMFGYRRPRPEVEEVETVDGPVHSKDLFKEASSLPSSDDVQVNLGRVLQSYRSSLASHVHGAFAFEAEVEPITPGKRAVSPEDDFQAFFAEIRRELGVPAASSPVDDPGEVLSRLKKAIQIFESRRALEVESRAVLESFDGYVDSIDGDTAYVTLESRSNGDVLYGEYPAQELLSRGIHEQTRFLCETVRAGGAGRVHFAPLPKNQVTDEEARAIAEQMREAFPGDDDSDIAY